MTPETQSFKVGDLVEYRHNGLLGIVTKNISERAREKFGVGEAEGVRLYQVYMISKGEIYHLWDYEMNLK